MKHPLACALMALGITASSVSAQGTGTLRDPTAPNAARMCNRALDNISDGFREQIPMFLAGGIVDYRDYDCDKHRVYERFGYVTQKQFCKNLTVYIRQYDRDDPQDEYIHALDKLHSLMNCAFY
ncbi:MAG: hypothetical protein VX730_06990 [Pseudomonadota bacterium]|nr:hypothetical protein [Pseudomonadota bacterium]